MNNFRGSFVLLSISVVAMMALANAQDSLPLNQIQVTRADSIEVLKKYKELASLSAPERRIAFTDASAADKSSFWRVHLALYLVKRPELSEAQRRVVLDAISLSSPEFFAAIDSNALARTSGEDALRSLTQRALSAFPKDEAAEVFSNLGGGTADDDILQRYNQISALALKQRKAAFRNASTRDKSSLWRTHLALSLVRHPELNELQKQIIVEAMSLATDRSFEVGFDRVRGGIRSLENQAIVAFTKEDGIKIFATLGDVTAQATNSLDAGSSLPKNVASMQTSDFRPYSRLTRNRFAAGQDFDLAGDACVCSTNSDWCPINGHCNGTVCSQTNSGCGFLWSYPCNGASCN